MDLVPEESPQTDSGNCIAVGSLFTDSIDSLLICQWGLSEKPASFKVAHQNHGLARPSGKTLGC